MWWLVVYGVAVASVIHASDASTNGVGGEPGYRGSGNELTLQAATFVGVELSLKMMNGLW